MKQATQKQINDFIKYRSQHIALVERIGQVVFGENFSDHDFDKCTADAEKLNLFALRNAAINKEYEPRGDIKDLINKMPGEHVKLNKHHPEYWDDSIKAKNWDEANPPQVHASRMPKKYLCELACDWASVALKRNQPIFTWYNKVCTGDNPRFIFTDNQKKYIIECLTKIMNKIHDEKLYYPGITYNAKQVDPITEESMEESRKNPFDVLLEYSKQGLLNDIEELENQALNHYKKDNDPIRKAVAAGKITNCEDIKELAQGLNESILDIPHKDYCKDLLADDDKMKPEVRNQILNIINKWKEQINFDFNISEIYAKGSLLSKRYNDTTDIDISIVTDMTKDQLDEIFSIIPKGQNIEGTDHPLDFYVLTDNEHTPEKNLDNIYDVLNDKWIKRTEEYDNEIPTDYLIQVANFLINGSVIALQNFESDKTMYEYYKNISSEEYDISDSETKEILEDKKRDLRADLDGLNIALHMISSFRQEAYDDKEGAFRTVLEIKSSNPHVTLNEQLSKILEKFGIKEKLRAAVKECTELLKDEGDEDLESITEEVSSGAFAGMIPENNRKIVDLQESQNKSMGLTFGRFNPPTIGHLNVLVKAVHDLNVDSKRVYLSHSQDKKKNPLPYEDKIIYLKAFVRESPYNDVEVCASPRSKLIDILQDIYKEGFTDVTLVIGSDRFESMQYIKKYNGMFDDQGNGYNFNSIEFTSAGTRDEDSTDELQAISASKLRQLALEGDFENFRKGVPTKEEAIAKDLFDDLIKYMN